MITILLNIGVIIITPIILNNNININNNNNINICIANVLDQSKQTMTDTLL